MNNNLNIPSNDSIQSNTISNQGVNSKKPKKKRMSQKKKILLIWSLIMIIIISSIIVIFLVFTKQEKGKSNESEEVVQAPSEEETDTESFTYNGLLFEMIKGYDYKTDNKIISIIKTDKTEMYLLSLIKYKYASAKEEDFLKQLELEGYKAENVKKDKYNKQEIITAEITTDGGNKFIAFLTSSPNSNYSFYGIAIKNKLEYDYKLVKSIQKILSGATEFDYVEGGKFLTTPVFSTYKAVIQSVNTDEPEEGDDEEETTNMSGASANSVLDTDEEVDSEEVHNYDDIDEEETEYDDDEDYDEDYDDEY